MILITRHGQTAWNVDKRIQGKTDIELNENGISQAEVLAEKLSDEEIDIIVASTLKRAMVTAEIINEKKNVPIIPDSRFIERNYGEFEGKTSEEFDYYSFWDYEKNIDKNGVETIQDFFSRIYSALDEIKEKYPGKNVLIVSHTGVARVIRCYFNNSIPGSKEIINLSIRNCEVLKVEE